jgi:rare lipoprotein A (peptidoglycan hydrolase)
VIAAIVAAGIASWFNPYQPQYTGQHVCAMNAASLLGKRVQIFNLDNGRSSWCVVIGSGPFVARRVVDVSPAVRNDLGMGGLAHVSVYQSDKRRRP